MLGGQRALAREPLESRREPAAQQALRGLPFGGLKYVCVTAGLDRKFVLSDTGSVMRSLDAAAATEVFLLPEAREVEFLLDAPNVGPDPTTTESTQLFLPPLKGNRTITQWCADSWEPLFTRVHSLGTLLV